MAGSFGANRNEEMAEKVWPKDFFAMKKSVDLCYIC